MSRAVTAGVVSLAAIFCVGLVWLGGNRFMAERRALSHVELDPDGIAGVTATASVPLPPCSNAGKLVLETPELVIHVVGAVQRPGVYRMPVGARVQEAIDAAGGATEAGRPNTLNLAAPLLDGEKLFVPNEEQTVQPDALPAESQGATRAPVQAEQPKTAQQKPKVRVNTASASELDAVSYVTPKVAAAIVAYRRDNGPFQTLDDLINVSGIGAATLAKIKPHLTL